MKSKVLPGPINAREYTDYLVMHSFEEIFFYKRVTGRLTSALESIIRSPFGENQLQLHWGC